MNTQAALDADLAAWDAPQGNITLNVRVDSNTAASLTALHGVPDGNSTIALLGIGIAGLVGLRRKFTV